MCVFAVRVFPCPRMLVLAEEYGATTLLSAGETRVIESDNIASKLTDISPVDLKTLSIGIEDGSSPRARRNTDGNAAAQPAAKISFENVENLAVEGPEENVRVQFSVFKRESLFHRAVDTQPRDAAAANGRDAVTPPNLQLNTAIVSAKLGQGRAEFDGTVRLDFRLKKVLNSIYLMRDVRSFPVITVQYGAVWNLFFC